MAKKEISRKTFIKGLAAGAASIAAFGALSTVEKAKSGSGAAGAGSAVVPDDIKAAASGLSFTPGTYEATAKGLASDVKVTMTFDETTITACDIDVSGETPDIGAMIGDEMAQKIVTSQSADVDAVSGATITSEAIKKAAADCISQASGTTVAVGESASGADWLGEAPEVADSDITETLDTDMLIVGVGTAGWPALMTAAEEGVNVLAIEKGKTPTNVREDIGAIGTKWQKESIKQFPEMEIDKTEAIEDIVRYATGYCKYDLIKLWANESAETTEWIGGILEDSGKYFMQHEGGIGDTRYPERDKAYATGHSPHKTEDAGDDVTTTSVFMDHLAKYPNAELRCNCELVKLLQDDSGKVIGAIAKSSTLEAQADGTDKVTEEHYVKINVAKAVLMSTSGYATNGAMMNALQPMTQEMKVQCKIGSKGDGSGIKAMLWAGAAMDPIHTSMMFNRCAVKPDEVAGADTVGAWFWFGEQPFLKVNLNGERFCNESGPYEFMLHSMEMQPYHTYVDVFDANNKQYTEQFQEVGCCRLWPFDNGAISNRDYDSCWESNEQLIEDGYLIKADTLEELAEKLNIPSDTFVKTVERYNELCAKGVDEDYNKSPHRMTPVDTAPFYGIRTCAWHLTTLDGCSINTNMQVLREDGSVIEGLYAAGDCSGNFFANNYPNLFTGLACGRSMTFGRHAAKYIASL